MDKSKFIVSNQKKESISLQRVKMLMIILCPTESGYIVFENTADPDHLAFEI